MIKIDARGKQCPLPVIEAKNAIDSMQEPGTIVILVDNEIAAQNVMKMAVHKGMDCSSKGSGGEYEVSITADSVSKQEEMQRKQVRNTAETGELCAAGCAPGKEHRNSVVILSSSCMGSGDEKLGKVLMKGFLYALSQQETLPDTVIMYNSGAFLSIENSDSLEDLRSLEAQGVEILTCGTCLNHYGLTEKLAVGSVTNMYDIAEKMTGADRLIKP